MPLIQLHIPLPHSVKQVCGTHFRWKSQVDLFFLMRVKPVTRFYHNVSSRRINIVFTRQAVAAEALELDPQECSKARSEFQDSRSGFGRANDIMLQEYGVKISWFHDLEVKENGILDHFDPVGISLFLACDCLSIWFSSSPWKWIITWDPIT